jgi:PRTRC genetic system ThiF family protein
MAKSIRVHYIHKQWLNPNHPIEIHLIGVGGTGSHMMSHLARMHMALVELGHEGLHVIAYDNKKVNNINPVRQLFGHSDIGRFKAEVIVERINRFYGLNWEYRNMRWSHKDYKSNRRIIISCVDTVGSRKDIFKLADARSDHYVLDIGNGKDYGQIILSTRSSVQPKSGKYIPVEVLKNVFQIHGKIKSVPNSESCNVFDSINSQGLMTNAIMAANGAELLWKFFNDKVLTYHGVYVNLTTMKTTPIPI